MIQGWNYIIMVCSAVLLTLLIYFEYKRANKARQFWRIVASVFAVLALAAMALPLTYTTSVLGVVSHNKVLITKGFNSDSVDFFLRDMLAGPAVYTLDADLAKNGKAELLVLPDRNNIYHVFGNGLKPAELPQLREASIVPHLTKSGSGIIYADWQQTLRSGETLQVQGTFNNTLSSEVKLVLTGLNTALDSVIIPPYSASPFNLACVPKHLERAIYTVRVTAGSRLIEEVEIPVEIQKGKPLKILMLVSSPAFEYNFLKNWLAGHAFQVSYRSRISRDKFSREQINFAGPPIDRLSSSLLTPFDVLIADGNELSQLGKDELGLIQKQVRDNGLGIIILSDSTVNRSHFYSSIFSSTASRPLPQKKLTLSLGDLPDVHMEIPAEDIHSLRPQARLRPLLTESHDEVLAAVAAYGTGRIVVSTAVSTFALSLSGNSAAYSSLWTCLLNNVSKRSPKKGSLVFSRPSLVNDPARLTGFTETPEKLPLIAGNIEIPKIQDMQLPFLYHGVLWPRHKGWLPLLDGKGEFVWSYIHGAADWATLSAARNREVTFQYFLEHNGTRTVDYKAERNEHTAIPKIYFFIIFIVSCAYLWYESKLA